MGPVEITGPENFGGSVGAPGAPLTDLEVGKRSEPLKGS